MCDNNNNSNNLSGFIRSPCSLGSSGPSRLPETSFLERWTHMTPNDILYFKDLCALSEFSIYPKLLTDFQVALQGDPNIPSLQPPHKISTTKAIINTITGETFHEERYEDQNSIFLEGGVAHIALDYIMVLMRILERIYQTYPALNYAHRYAFYYNPQDYLKKGLRMYVWFWDSRLCRLIVGHRSKWTAIAKGDPEDINLESCLKIYVPSETYVELINGKNNYGIPLGKMEGIKCVPVLDDEGKKEKENITESMASDGSITSPNQYAFVLNLSQPRTSTLLRKKSTPNVLIIPYLPVNVDKEVLKRYIMEMYRCFSSSGEPPSVSIIESEDFKVSLGKEGVIRPFKEDNSTQGGKHCVAQVRYHPKSTDAFVAINIVPRMCINGLLYDTFLLPTAKWELVRRHRFVSGYLIHAPGELLCRRERIQVSQGVYEHCVLPYELPYVYERTRMEEEEVQRKREEEERRKKAIMDDYNCIMRSSGRMAWHEEDKFPPM